MRYYELRYWQDQRNQRNFLDFLSNQFDIKKPSDWYNIKTSQFIENGGKSLLNYHNSSLISALKFAYPGFLILRISILIFFLEINWINPKIKLMKKPKKQGKPTK